MTAVSPGCERLDLPQRVDLDRGVVVAAEVAERRDVFLRAVAEGRLDAELAGQAGLGERIFGRVDPEGGDVAAALVPRGAVGDPLAEEVVCPGTFAETLLAAVLDLAGGLEEQQTGVGVGEVDAPAFQVAGKREVVLGGVVAEEGEAETAFALEGAVTGAGVAAHAAEHAHDVPLEIDLVYDASAGQLDIGAGGRGGEGQDGAGQKGEPESGHAGSVHSTILR